MVSWAPNASRRRFPPPQLHGGEERQIDAAELVPGDVVLFASGARVPADCRYDVPGIIFCCLAPLVPFFGGERMNRDRALAILKGFNQTIGS